MTRGFSYQFYKNMYLVYMSTVAEYYKKKNKTGNKQKTNPAYKKGDLENYFKKKRRNDEFEKAKLLWESSGQLRKIAQTESSPRKNATRKKLTWAQRKKKERADARAAIDSVKKNKTRKVSKKQEAEYATRQSTWARGELEDMVKEAKKRNKNNKKRNVFTKIHHKFQKMMGSKAKRERDERRAEELEKEAWDSHVYNATRAEREFQERREKGKKKTYKEKNEERIVKEIQDDQDASQRRLKLKDSLPTLIINNSPSKIKMPAPPVPPPPSGGTRRRKRKRKRKTKKKRRRRKTKKRKKRRRNKTKRRRR
jgi:hypothetical protein